MDTTHPVSTVVPDGYRANRLPDNIREWVDEQSHRLNELYHNHDVNKGAELRQFKEKKESHFIGSVEWNWFGKGSERTVAGLGATVNGEPIYPTFERVVVKFKFTSRPLDDPGLSREERTVDHLRGGNLHELGIWKYACDHGHDEHFATILDYSEYGDWIAQRYYVPVYPHGQRSSHARNGGCDHLRDEVIPYQFKDELEVLGYNPHVKDGNIGVAPDTHSPVVIDFGQHFKIEAMDSDDLFSYTLSE